MKIRYLLTATFCLFVSFSLASAQKAPKKILITGTVIDDTNTPVVGGILTIDRKSTNNSTNRKGEFKMKVDPEAKNIGVLVTKNEIYEQPIAGKTSVKITIPTSARQQIEDQIMKPGDEAVNIGYGTVKQRDLLTSVNRIDATQSKYAGYTNIYDMIKGTVPGVQVVGQSVRIQGASSLMLSTEPLYVVDGSVVNSIANIPPIEVKSVEVLKGSSAAIYGSRGANGVILITLKKGELVK